MKQKAVFIINNLVVGGVERFTRDVLPHLDRDQLDIFVVTVWGSGSLSTVYQSLNVPIYWAGGKIWYSSKNPLLKPYFVIVSPFTFIRLLLILHRLRPDVVMTCLTQADIMGITAAYLSGVPRRIIRQADVKPLGRIVRWLKQNLAIRLSTKIIANSLATKQFVESYFRVSEEKVIPIPNGVDLAHFQINRPLSPEDPVVGFLGRLEEIKGAAVFLAGIKLLRDQWGVSPRVVIYGDGSLRSELQQYVETHKLTTVKFMGEVADPVLALTEIDVLVVPSLSEGFGLVTLEGLVSGRAVVASDLPVMRDLIISGQNGILFPVSDASQLASQLADLLQQPEKIRQLQQRAADWSVTNGIAYNIVNTAKRYQSVILGL
ncbi:MAG: glycosyltransferase family 4 protein [Patescibacteria group bacterium]|jgi:glycosyltransferase involved in cell wall biosynthesis